VLLFVETAKHSLARTAQNGQIIFDWLKILQRPIRYLLTILCGLMFAAALSGFDKRTSPSIIIVSERTAFSRKLKDRNRKRNHVIILISAKYAWSVFNDIIFLYQLYTSLIKKAFDRNQWKWDLFFS